jgi:sugar phosphate isomerase/epimerase
MEPHTSRLMLCMNGTPDQILFLPEIAALGAGIELGSYGMRGVRSEQDWQARLTLHQAIRAQFHGPLAIHGPFIGMEYGHIDHLIRQAVDRRLDMTLDAAKQLSASRVVLHSGFKPEIDLFNLQESWLKQNIDFWQAEMPRWAEAGIGIVIENEIERLPDLLIRLVDAVDSPFLSLCMDTGHQHLFSEMEAVEWVRRMGQRLVHVHLQDNDRTGDKHWPLGRGTFDFERFYAAVGQYAPHATLSLEVEDSNEVKMADLRKLARRFVSEPHASEVS